MEQDALVPRAGLARRAAVGAVEPFAAAGRSVAATWTDYNLQKLRGDMVAGLTVAVVAVPQAMAYAFIAEVPPVYGLYTLVIQCALGALFNAHPLLSVGPVNTQSLLIASIVTRLEDPGNVDAYLQLVVALTCVKGLLQLVMAYARLGTLVRYVSHAVVVGFTAGAAVLILSGQVGSFLGVAMERSAGQWPGLVGDLQRLAPGLGHVSLGAVGLGMLALAIVIGCRWISRLIPGPLLAVAATGLIVAAGGVNLDHVGLVGSLPPSLPAFAMPKLTLEMFEKLVAGGLALALVGLMEAYSISKSLAVRTGTQVSANQELFGQGTTNLVSSLFSCMSGSGSFSRSALNHFAGGRTLMANVFNALFVLAIYLLLGRLAGYIPRAAIAAILFVVAFGLIDWRFLFRVSMASKADLAVCVVTFLATLTLPLMYAVFTGMALNIALYLHHTSQLQLSEMVQTTAGPFLERPLGSNASGQAITFLQLEGSLFFGVADELQNRLGALAHSPVRVVVMRLKRTQSIDSTVLTVLDRFLAQMRAGGKHVVLCGVRPDLMQCLRGFGLVDRIGEANVFETSFGVFASAKLALRRARELINDEAAENGGDTEDPLDGWTYEI